MTKRLMVVLLALICAVSLLTAVNTVYAAEVDQSVQMEGSAANSARIVSTGFVQNADDTWSYYENGVKVTSSVIYSGGYYYGFDWNGIMYDDTSFDLYDSDAGRWVYYRAKSGGALYVNEWVQPYDNDTYYYYGAGGKAPSGLATVDGIQYYFYYYGEMMCNSSATVDDVTYIADSKGKLTAMTGTGWKNVDGDYYYVANDELYTNGVYQIGGSYYGFNGSGRMYDDTSFDLYDSDAGCWVYYRAKSGGALYVNEWVQPYEYDPSTYYYYGAGGKAPSGLATVNGIQYYFYSNGQMMYNSSATVGDVTYIADSKGQLTAMTGNGWKEVDGNYYYVADGKLYTSGVYQISGSYYGFNSSGRMYDDTSFSFWDSNEGRSVYYRAKSGGALYVNEWVQPYEYNDTYYYYGVGGKAPSGLATVDGIQYYFYYNGRMMTSDAVTVDDVTYIADSKGKLTALTGNGWVQVDGDYYYVVDGELYKDSVYQIGGVYYGFGWNGRMYDDESFDLYDSEADRYVYYRAKSGGALYVNEWVQPYEYDPSTYYYYGAGGKAPSGLATVDGIQYYFDYDGEMLRNGAVTVDDVTYIASENGQVTAMTGNGWKEVDGNYYYVADGKLYKNGVYQIGGSYYGFNGSGRMYDDTSFDFYDYDAGRWVYYRAKSGGALYVNEWVQPYEYNDTYYYYGVGGKAPSGLTTVGGVQYYFYNDGEMLCNGAVTVDDVTYIASENGQVTAMTGNGWKKVDGNYYYVADGKLYTSGVYQIGGVYYGFGWNGRMYDDASFGLYDSEAGRSVYYRAKSGGALYVNEWVQPYDNDTYYYYGAGGKAPSGLTTVDGIQYYFDYDGEMLCNGAWTVDGVTYIASSTGKLTTVTKDGWVHVDDYYYYVSDSELYTGGIYKISGVYYGFEWNGRMYNDTSFGLYDYDADRYVYYRAKSGGALYCGEWYKNYGEWYYYDSNCVRVSDQIKNINGKNYYFYSYGEMAVNSVVTYNGATYKIDADGVAVKCADGWVQHPIEDGWMYVQNGELFSDGLLKVDGKTYVFKYDYLAEDAITYLNDSYYASDSKGVLITKTGWQTVNGSYVYVESGDGKLATGWKLDGGKWYYLNPQMVHDTIFLDDDGTYYTVDANGLCTAIRSNGFHNLSYGTIYIENGKMLTSTWKQINGSWYYFGMNGKMVTGVYTIDGERYLFDGNGKMLSGGWAYIGDSTYYTESSGKLVTGLQTIGGNKYIFSSYGQMLYAQAYTTDDGKSYAIGVNGVVLGQISSEGWNLFDGKYYYIKNGKLITDQTMKIDGKIYGFDYNGVMFTNTDYYGYFFGADGSAISGWYKYNDAWYYADPASLQMYYYGKYTINGETYIFNDHLRVGTFLYDGEVVTTTNSGAVISSKKPSDGWNYVDGSVLYYQNGQPYTGWVGNYYVEDGYMYYNGVIYADGKYYYLDKYGKNIKNQWIERRGTYALAKADGSLYYNEWYNSGSTWYYFSGVWMASDGIYDIDGVQHRFDENGKWLGEVSAQLTGWRQLSGEYYYYHAGRPVTGQYLIDGHWYFFDYDGTMIRDSIIGYDENFYYYGSNGARAEYTGWQQIDGSWLYFNDNHTLRTGWIQEGAKSYYIYVRDYYYGYDFEVFELAMATGYQAINNQLYYFNTDGICQGTRGVKNGWYQAGKDWYYFINSELVNGYLQINGTGYYFMEGRMMTDGICYVNGYSHYFGADGKQVTAKGWYKTKKGWMYIGESGEVYEGIRLIDGKVYYFDGYYWEG